MLDGFRDSLIVRWCWICGAIWWFWETECGLDTREFTAAEPRYGRESPYRYSTGVDHVVADVDVLHRGEDNGAVAYLMDLAKDALKSGPGTC